MKHKRIKIFVLGVIALTQFSHAAEVVTDKKIYVKNSDESGSAWLTNYPTAKPYTDDSGNDVPFYTWHYYWGDQGSGPDDQAYADVDVSTTSGSKDDKFVSLILYPTYMGCDGKEVWGDAVDPDPSNANFTVCEIKSKALSQTVSNNDVEREKVGVCEVVQLDVVPAINADWKTDGLGSVKPSNGSSVLWYAPEYSNDSETISPTFSGGSSGGISFSIVEPTREDALIIGETNTLISSGRTFGPGEQGVVMILLVYVYPVDVSFAHVIMKEMSCSPTGANGYFWWHTPPSHPEGHDFNLGWDNGWYDNAGFGLQPKDDPIINPVRWRTGQFSWNIPWLWHVSGSDENHYNVPSYTSVMSIDSSNGGSSVTKFGCQWSRTP